MANFNDLSTIHTFSASPYSLFPLPVVSFSGYAFKNKQAFHKGHHDAVFGRQQIADYKSQCLCSTIRKYIHCKSDFVGIVKQ